MAPKDATETDEDRSDETLTPKEAWRLTEEKGRLGKEVAAIFDISEARVSQLKSQYQEGLEEGKQSVEPGDFEAEELKEALGDSATDNQYEHTCPRCNGIIDSPDSAGTHDCPKCGEPIEWDESEI